MALLAQMSLPQWFFVLLLICICCFLMLIILVQKGRGEGLSGAFGGGGGSGAFGAKTGDVFTWITVVVAVSFLLISVVANFVLDESPQRSGPTVTTTTTTRTTSETVSESAPDSVPVIPPSDGGESPFTGAPAGEDVAVPPVGAPEDVTPGVPTDPPTGDSEETPGP